MVEIEDIKVIIEELIRTNELIVNTYDSRLLCKNYDETKKTLKELLESKTKLIESLEDSINEFFDIGKVGIFNFKLNSFRLMSSPIGFEYIFAIPRSVDKSSRQYFCFISLMEDLVKKYDSIVKERGIYMMFDISSSLDINNLIKGD